MNAKTALVFAIAMGCPVVVGYAHDDDRSHDHDWQPEPFARAAAYAPTPIPDRVTLTWNGDPATTQAVTWRTDTSVRRGVAEIAIANDNGRAMQPARVEAESVDFQSDLGEARYHTVTFSSLEPDTLYAYRVGDGENWSEYFHFRSASRESEPFSFVYFGDAQNDLKTHWSRVFREAFRDAPRAAFMLHAGDLVNDRHSDAEWGEWHGAPAWVNGTVPVIATPGNHEYYRANPGPENERFWNAKDGRPIAVTVDAQEVGAGPDLRYRVAGRTADGRSAVLEYNDDDKITRVDEGAQALLGYTENELLGRDVAGAPLSDRRQDEGTPAVSGHWRPQFAFPVQSPPAGLEETCYYLDFQGARIVSLDSNAQREAQVPWLRRVLENNPQRWTILTFHHPMYSPARDRDNPQLRELWKPLLDEFKVDLVLTGHDHTYARTGAMKGASGENVPIGYQQAYDPEIGTVYVVSVSGPKMYPITKGDFATRVAEDTQLYQIIHVSDTALRYEARAATGRLYDAFTLEKRAGRPNALIELLPPENRRAPERAE